jgi:hypothetical protein
MPEPIIATSFAALLGCFSGCFTRPGFAMFQHIVSGWALTLGRRTVTNVALAAGSLSSRHHASFQRFFRLGRWTPDDIGRILARLVVSKLVPSAGVILVAVDDTLARHTGKHISSAGMHRDPLLSTASKVLYHFGHVWVVLSVVIESPWGKHFALPVCCRLYRSKKTAETMKTSHQKKTELAVQMLEVFAEQFPSRRIRVLADNGFANRKVISQLPGNTALLGRGVMDARIYDKPDPPAPGKRGRPAVMGRLLPSPEQRANNPETQWCQIDAHVYGRNVVLKVQVFDAIWRKSGQGGMLRFVLIRGWPGHKRNDVLISTDLTLDATQIIEDYCRRWTIEETFHWCKSKLGLEDPQNRAERAVQRTAPISLWSYSLVVIWYITVGRHGPFGSPPSRPWYVSTKVPAFSDMLASLRRASWSLRLAENTGIDDRPIPMRSIQKFFDAITDAVGYG